MKTISEKTKKEMQRIIDLLRNEGQMHIRGISRALGIHPMAVSRIIDSYLSPFLEISEIKEFGLNVKLIKIREGKENITIDDILKYLEVKKKIKNNKGY